VQGLKKRGGVLSSMGDVPNINGRSHLFAKTILKTGAVVKDSRKKKKTVKGKKETGKTALT